MAVSEDMVHWKRYGDGPVIDNGNGISGDPQIVRMGDLWVMFYFGAGWKPALRHVRVLARPGALDEVDRPAPDRAVRAVGQDVRAQAVGAQARRRGVPLLLRGGDEGRVIALATSKDLRGGGSSKSGD